MATLADGLALEMHRFHLRKAGFKVDGHVLTCFKTEHKEFYLLLGNPRTSPAAAPSFHLACGIAFRGLAPRYPDRDFKNTHAWTRSEFLSPKARSDYVLTEGNRLALMEDMTAVILDISAYFSRRLEVLRDLYRTKQYDRKFLADPELRDLPGRHLPSQDGTLD